MERTITVKGKAEISVSPDYTTVVLSLKEKDKNYGKAFEKLKQKTVEISECANIVGISTDDIKTTNYSAQMIKKTGYDKKGKYIQVDDGYACSQTLSIGFNTDPIFLGELINVISKKIENPNMTINFSIKDRTIYEEELLKKVTEDARKKAKVFCEPSGAKIGRLITVNYQRGNTWSFPTRPYNFSSMCSGNTEELSPMSPAARIISGNTPSLSSAQVPMIDNIIPQDRYIEDEAIFTWEIIDNE